MNHLLFGSCYPGLHPQTAQAVRMCSRKRPTPILVTDVLDTLVADPFFNGMSTYFGFPSFQDFIAAKTPDLWVQFELGNVSEDYVARNFFRDGRNIDLLAFKRFLKSSYQLLPGIHSMLLSLQHSGIDVHLCSNYPVWADLIEESLQLTSKYAVNWTFVSGREGVRKPDPAAYMRVAENAGVDIASCILLDDREANCDGALSAGFLDAVLFESAFQASTQLQKIYAGKGVLLELEPSAGTSAL